MASSGNTWCKKLMAKQKCYNMRERYGVMVPLADRIKKAKLHGTKVLNEIEDLPDELPRDNKPKLVEKRMPLPVNFGKVKRWSKYGYVSP